MNAETRAKEIGMTPEQRVRDLMANAIPDGMDEASFGELDEYLHTRIAAAIRSAENDKLEEAARLMDRVMADSKAALIRTLKTED